MPYNVIDRDDSITTDDVITRDGSIAFAHTITREWLDFHELCCCCCSGFKGASAAEAIRACSLFKL
jgi:hypothetical protein